MGVEAGQDVLDQVVGHGARSADFFDFQRDGVGLEHADPDGKDGVAVGVFQDHNGQCW